MLLSTEERIVPYRNETESQIIDVAIICANFNMAAKEIEKISSYSGLRAEIVENAEGKC